MDRPFPRDRAEAAAHGSPGCGRLTGTVLLGILGCGRSAERFHLPAIARLPGARLTAAWDPGPERRDLIARAAPGCRAFPSAEALFHARVVDAVIIASPPETHATFAVQALGAGVPVLVEPPLAASIEEADRIRQAEQTARLPVMVGFTRRWWDPVEHARRALAGGAVEAVSVEATIATEPQASDTPAGDPIRPLTAHLDLVRHLLDREIATVSTHRDTPRDLDVRLSFHGEGSAVCRSAPAARPAERITIRTSTRRYEIRMGSDRIWPAAGAVRRGLDLAESAARRLTGGRRPLAGSYERQLKAFIESVRSRAPVTPGTADGLAAMLAAEAARRSLAEGGVPIPVPPIPGT